MESDAGRSRSPQRGERYAAGVACVHGARVVCSSDVSVVRSCLALVRSVVEIQSVSDLDFVCLGL